MSDSRAADIFSRLARVQSFFPDTFNVTVECLRHGIDSIRLTLGGFFDIAAAYDPEKKAIELNSVIDRRGMAEMLSRRHGVKVEPEEVPVWMFFHELGHHLRRRQLLKIEGSRALIFSRSREVLQEEREAEGYAKRRFIEWKRGKSL